MSATNSQAEALCSHLAAHLRRSAPDAIIMSPTRVQHERLGGRSFFSAQFFVENMDEIRVTTTPTQGDDIEVTVHALDPRIHKLFATSLDKWVGNVDRVDDSGFTMEVPPTTKTSATIFRAFGSVAEQIKQTVRKHVAARLRTYDEIVNMSKNDLDKFIKNEIFLHDGISKNPLGGKADDVNPLDIIRSGFKILHTTNWYDVVAWKDRKRIAVIYRKKGRHYPSMLYLTTKEPATAKSLLQIATSLEKLSKQ